MQNSGAGIQNRSAIGFQHLADLFKLNIEFNSASIIAVMPDLIRHLATFPPRGIPLNEKKANYWIPAQHTTGMTKKKTDV